jgi:hypothetical protein
MTEPPRRSRYLVTLGAAALFGAALAFFLVEYFRLTTAYIHAAMI